MSVVKGALIVAVAVAITVGSYRIGHSQGVRSVVIPHVYVVDPANGNPIPLVVPDGTQIYVASPEGFEPGVYAGHSKDGKKILILPPSLLGDSGTPQQQSQTKHSAPEQSGGERLDRTSI